MIPLIDLLSEIRSCSQCELPLGPNPIVRAGSTARLLIIGQAPGTRVHASGIPWDDPSGDRLRGWLGIDKQSFYNEAQIAIVPMGFCYPGKGKSGDLPPSPTCAPLWHEPLLAHLENVEITLLIGKYAQNYYLEKSKETLTDRVRRWRDFTPRYWPLPHPSPRNQLWQKRNPWFDAEVVPTLRARVQDMKLEQEQQ
jgi:uracil-DNA glycosylase